MHPLDILSRIQSMTLFSHSKPEDFEAPPEPAACGFTPPTEPADPASPTTTTSTEIITADATISIYEEALAESRTTIRDEAKSVLAERIREVQATRTLLARQEAELAKLLKKTPEEIAMMKTFAVDYKTRRL